MTTVRDRESSRALVAPSVKVARWQLASFVVLAALYVFYTYFVVHVSDIGRLDRIIYDIHFKRDVLPHSLYEFLLGYVYFGQRGVATFVFLPYFVWTALRLRSARPLIMLGVGLLLLNVSVGAVKLVVGRLGPRVTSDVFNVHMGGDIYPSGHVSNVVVLYGLMAWISLRHRALFTGITVWLATSVGLATVLIGTHWFSDVVGAWLAGGLVLLALPWFMGPAERLVDRIYYRYVKHHTDPWVAKLQTRWPRLSEIGPHPVTVIAEPPTDPDLSGRR